MTLKELFLFFLEHREIIVVLMLIAPWLSWLVCVAIPGKQEEPFVLNFNLGLALLSVLLEVGYLFYATNTGGWSQIVGKADLLLLLAPLYYVGVSLWISRQRLPLSELPVFRVIQGLGMILAAFLLLAWIMSKIRLIFFSYLPFGFFILFLASLVGLAYLGYLKLRGHETSSTQSDFPTTRSNSNKKQPNDEVDGELERLRRQMKRKQK